MKIELFTALKTLNLSDEKAKEVVEAVEEHIAVKINEANKGLVEVNKGLETQLKAQTAIIESQLSSIKWMMGFIGGILGIIALGPIIAKFIN